MWMKKNTGLSEVDSFCDGNHHQLIQILTFLLQIFRALLLAVENFFYLRFVFLTGGTEKSKEYTAVHFFASFIF